MALVLDQFTEQVQALYVAYFGRAGEPDGFAYWVGELASGRMTFAEAAASFAQQPEALTQHNFLAHPYFFTPASFVDSLYGQLLGREADTVGRAYWIDQLNKAVGNPTAIGVLIAQFISDADESNGDAAIIQNKVDAAIYFAQELRSEGIGGTTDGATLHPKYLAVARDVVDNEITSDPASIETSEAELDAFINPPAPTPP